MNVVLPLLFLIVWAAAWAYVFWRIGWSPWWGLSMAVPGVNIAAFIAFVMSRWPIEEKVLRLESEIAHLRGNAVIIDVTPREKRGEP